MIEYFFRSMHFYIKNKREFRHWCKFELCKFSRIASVSMEIIWINAMVEMNNTMHYAINALFKNIQHSNLSKKAKGNDTEHRKRMQNQLIFYQYMVMHF